MGKRRKTNQKQIEVAAAAVSSLKQVQQTFNKSPELQQQRPGKQTQNNYQIFIGLLTLTHLE